LAPRAVINAAAYTAVDKAEEDEELATIINGVTPTSIAQACAELQIPLVHISTDYVFEGSGEVPWKPGDTTAPQNAYGRSKLAGEEGILGSGATHAILRTSWVVSANGANFVKNMLRLSETRDTLSVVADQIGGPTPARDIAGACLMIAEQLQEDPLKSGTYHYSGAPNVSWADLASEIFTQAARSVTVTPITTAEYPTPAKRPLNSRMDCSTTNSTFGIQQPDWRTGLKEILKELKVTA
jgi:dTDP-4-dehydrorhamnose reductase